MAVDADSAAARAGIQPGDVVIGLGTVRLKVLEDFAAVVPRLPASGQAKVSVVRGPLQGYILMRF